MAIPARLNHSPPNLLKFQPLPPPLRFPKPPRRSISFPRCTAAPITPLPDGRKLNASVLQLFSAPQTPAKFLYPPSGKLPGWITSWTAFGPAVLALEQNPTLFLASTALLGSFSVLFALRRCFTRLHGWLGMKLPYDRTVFGALEPFLKFEFTFMTVAQIALILKPAMLEAIMVVAQYCVVLPVFWFLDKLKTSALRNAFEEMTPMDSMDEVYLHHLSFAGSLVIGGMALSLVLRVPAHYACFLGAVIGTSLLSLTPYILADMGCWLEDMFHGNSTKVNSPPK